MVIQVPNDVQLEDTSELCGFPRCRGRVAVGIRGSLTQYCDEHCIYSRKMQHQKYQKKKSKLDKGLCVVYDCERPRAPARRRPGVLGRCCTEHAETLNIRSKDMYNRRKLRRVTTTL